MHLSAEQVEKFQKLYYQKFGEELSYEIAHEKAIKLMRMMEIVLKHRAQTPAK